MTLLYHVKAAGRHASAGVFDVFPRHPLSKAQESIFSYIALNYETPLLTTEDTPALGPLEVAE